MANFPSSLPSFSNPGAGDYLNSPAHHTQHSSANDELVQVATKVGVDASAVTTTHDYKLSGITAAAKAVSNTANETVAGNKTLSGNTILSGTLHVDGAAEFDSTSQFDSTNTFNGVTTFTKATKSVLVADSDGATITFDLNAGNIHGVTLGGNRTLALSNPSTGQAFILRIAQGGGSNTVTWFSTIKWAGGSAPTLTTTAGKADTFGFICTGSGTYDGYIIGQNI